MITGASTGIGRACAARLAAQGRTVVNLDIREPVGSPEFRTIRLDLRDGAEIRRAFSDIASRYCIGGLVNNAGIARSATLEETSADDLAICYSLNIEAMVNCTQAALPSLKQAGSGRIVNISSRAALGKKSRTAYAATKGGVISMTRVWALELAPFGITVNAVGPGPIATELFREVNPAGSPEAIALEQSVPLGRLGRPEDVAQAVAFFLDEESGFITGQTVYVCGGLTVGVAPV